LNQIKTDILIVGGGSAGIAAAISASQRGFSVTLIDSHSYLGGSATASEVGTICGIYHRNHTSESNYIISGFAKEFSEKVQLSSKTQPVVNRDGLHYLPYSINSYKLIAEEYIQNHGVRLFLNTKVVDIEVVDKKAKSCVINQGEKVSSVSFDAVIDCSGCSVLSRLANTPMIQSCHFQSAALVFSLKKVYCENEGMLSLILIKHLKQAKIRGAIEPSLENLFLVPGSLKNGKVSFKVAIPLEVTLTKNNLSSLRKKGLEMIDSLVRFLVNDIALFEEAEIDHIAEDVGIRTDYRSEGKYILTEEDVLTCRKFKNSVANCSWPIEEWRNSEKVKMDFLPPNEFYQIPEECLISAHIENLFFGGKNISASDRAIGSARVMGICLQTGTAAGNLASRYCNVNELKYSEIIEQ
jgi:hypothetical protein